MSTDKKKSSKPKAAAGRLGRTPSINRESIDAAVREVGADAEITMHGVAKVLGVNVTTLYRHTGGLDGLRRIYAAQLSEGLGKPPSPLHQSWQQWLVALAKFYRNALVTNPDLLQYAQAALDPDFLRLEQATKVLIEYGFEARDAVRAHAFLINNVVGYVHQELQTEAEIASGSAPTYSRLSSALQKGQERLPILSDLHLDDVDLDVDVNFEYFINYAVTGIAAQDGVPA